jgi:hypothetical protein
MQQNQFSFYTVPPFDTGSYSGKLGECHIYKAEQKQVLLSTNSHVTC